MSDDSPVRSFRFAVQITTASRENCLQTTIKFAQRPNFLNEAIQHGCCLELNLRVVKKMAIEKLRQGKRIVLPLL